MAFDPDFWRGRRVLVTGHTGFKGAWLCLWLESLGAHVSGLSAAVPTSPSMFELARVGQHMRGADADVLDAAAVLAAVDAAAPEVVLHLAAQPLVRHSLSDPAGTYAVNVLGTVNVLEAVRRVGRDVRAVVVVTSDKCYENRGGGRRFAEDDPLGGCDPYSSSKACAELVAASYRCSFFGGPDSPRLGTARAGNVIGGGDWGADRLMADVVRAVEAGCPLRVRSPDSVRPWQHVLSPLAGYLRLAQALYESPDAARAWNFGPRAGDERSVSWVVERTARLWEGALTWELDTDVNPPEAEHLALDSEAAEELLGWEPACDLAEGIALVVEWHRAHACGSDMREVSLDQVSRLAAAD